MKKFLKVLVIGLLGTIFVALVVLHVYYHTFSPNDRGIEVDQNNLGYFYETYDDCRQAFLTEAQKAMSLSENGEIFSVRVPGKTDNELFIDCLYLPPANDTSKLLVLSSAVHGIEGFIGSAVQQMFLRELTNEDLLSDMGLLMIHAVNPFGFKYERRATENNVDLNRGSGVDPALFLTKNEGYKALDDMLNPRKEVSENSTRNRYFYLVTISKMLKESMGALRQAILMGQYEIPDGVYFGGQGFEPQIDSLTAILPGIFQPYDQILAIDLHTGYGARRVLHLFPNQIDDVEIKAKTEAIFEGHQIDWGDSDDFYEISGGFASSYLEEISQEAEYLYMIFEWGTLDSQKTFGSIKSLQKVINENQGYHYGYKNDRQEAKIKENNMELYYPSSEAWRSEVLNSGRDMLKLVLKTYPEIN